MKKIVKKWNDTSLVLRIFCGLVIGAILGITLPNATAITMLGTLFVGALKAIAPILVFILVMSSLASANDKLGKKFVNVIVLYLLSTLLAAVVAVSASFLFPVSLKLTDAASGSAPQGIVEVLTNLLTNIVANPVDSLLNANYIGILAWAILLGIALEKAVIQQRNF